MRFQLDHDPCEPIFVIDPGKATGWASDDGRGDVTAAIADRDAVLDELWRFADAWRSREQRPTLVFETFTVTERTLRVGRDYSALEIIGAAKFIAQRFGFGKVVGQTPVDAKRLVTDWRLQDLQLWYPGREDHARDALRHLVLRLASQRVLTLRPRGET